MKTIGKVVLLFLASMVLGGCAMFGSELQYDLSNWWGVTGSQEVAEIKADKLAFEKLKETLPQTATIDGVPQGFKGLVANFSRYNRINIIINGPEQKRYLLAAGQTQDDYLIPGNYVATAYRGGTQIGNPWSFKVSARQYSYMGRAVHWYIYYED